MLIKNLFLLVTYLLIVINIYVTESIIRPDNVRSSPSASIIQKTIHHGSDQTQEYVCIPCGSDCDKELHKSPGTCSQCNMQLVKKSTVNIKTVQPSEICSYISKNPGVVLLDVRTKEEFEGKANPNFGSLKNAINIPIQELEKRVTEINNLKDKEIIVFCSHSRRSPRATYMLTQLGFTNVSNMAGGMSVMKDEGCKR